MENRISSTKNKKRYIFYIVIILISASCGSAKNPKSITNAQVWYENLPACPCENPDKNGVKINDGWAKDKGDIGKYHKGATECFRSYPPIETSEGVSGQQCCYDLSGKLITEGSGAGTPDKESTCNGENSEGMMTMRYKGILVHYTKDVKPWEEFGGVDSGWIKYNQLWKPNNGNNCPFNNELNKD